MIVALHLTNTGNIRFKAMILILHLVFIDSALQVSEWTDEWPDPAEAMIYCTPKNAVDNLNLGNGMDPTQVISKIIGWYLFFTIGCFDVIQQPSSYDNN